MQRNMRPTRNLGHPRGLFLGHFNLFLLMLKVAASPLNGRYSKVDNAKKEFIVAVTPSLQHQWKLRGVTRAATMPAVTAHLLPKTNCSQRPTANSAKPNNRNEFRRVHLSDHALPSVVRMPIVYANCLCSLQMTVCLRCDCIHSVLSLRSARV